MEDSARPSLQPQVNSLCEALYEQLGEYEAELEVIPKPNPDDFRYKEMYDSARQKYNREIRDVWDKIHKLMSLWPSGV